MYTVNTCCISTYYPKFSQRDMISDKIFWEKSYPYGNYVYVRSGEYWRSKHHVSWRQMDPLNCTVFFYDKRDF